MNISIIILVDIAHLEFFRIYRKMSVSSRMLMVS